MTGFHDRFADALRRRIFPNSPVHLKQIASAIGRSPNTVERWWRGENRITAEDLAAMAAFFAQRGDDAFVTEIYGNAGSAVLSPDDAARAIVRAVLAEMGGASELRDRFYWCTGAGEIHEAPAGHEEMARRHAKAQAHLNMSFAAYARRNYSWASLVRAPDRSVTIHYAERRMRPETARTLCRWLRDNAGTTAVVRIVDLGDREVTIRHADVASAIAAIEMASVIASAPKSRAWVSTRLPLHSIAEPRFISLLKAWHESPLDIVAATAALDGFKGTSLFRLGDDDQVISLIVASDLDLKAHELEGKNVLERKDTAYGAMIAARINASRDEPTYHDLAGAIEGRGVRYINLSLPERGGGRVVSASAVLELEAVV